MLYNIHQFSVPVNCSVLTKQYPIIIHCSYIIQIIRIIKIVANAADNKIKHEK